MGIDPSVRAEQASWSVPGSKAFYRANRNRPEDLYESERTFLPQIAAQVSSMLDVGCAAGGFSRIVRAFNPSIRYVGADITPELIEIARHDYPDVEFCLSDGLSFPFEPESFEFVHCTGVLHVNSRHREMIAAMWRMTRRFLVYDVRLTEGPSVTGTLTHEFGHEVGDPLPYHVINVEEHLAEVAELVPPPAVIRAIGYVHSPTATARLPVARVIMAVVLLERHDGHQGPPELDVRLER